MKINFRPHFLFAKIGSRKDYFSAGKKQEHLQLLSSSHHNKLALHSDSNSTDQIPKKMHTRFWAQLRVEWNQEMLFKIFIIASSGRPLTKFWVQTRLIKFFQSIITIVTLFI